MDEPPRSLERYDVLDRIAVGGMAEVFLAKAYGAHGFEKTLAIKRILPELARDPEFEARFIAEAKVAVRLSHANVVQVFDFGRIAESLFIAMEYVDGLDLAALLRRYRDARMLVPLPAAFHIAIEIMRALDFAHGHSVVHRDVSPSNTLLSRAGEVKIADFGIAVAAQPHGGAGPGPRKVMGKWRYMSPEQARGDTLDTRSDLFSAAAVIYELFTGTRLFPGEDSEDIIRNIESMPIPGASSVRPDLPPRLDAILAAPLARRPTDRPARPAIVLRQLIELSYESAIVATALDVAEAVAAVLPPSRPSGGRPLDSVIRKQLDEAIEPSVTRRTAVGDGEPPAPPPAPAGERGDVSTGLFRRVGPDGVSRLELDEPAATAGADRADPFGLTETHHDAGRHPELAAAPETELAGAPPPIAIGRDDLRGLGHPEVIAAPRRTGRARWWIAIAGGVVVLAGALAVRGLSDRRDDAAHGDARHGDAATLALVPIADAAPAPRPPATGMLEIDTDPPGAHGTVAGHEFGPTPVTVDVAAGVQLAVKIDLPGYVSYVDDRVVVQPGGALRLAPHLGVAPAHLRVTGDPAGSEVRIAGVVRGLTPLDIDLPAATGVELVVVHAGYTPATAKIDLVAGELTRVDRALKPVTRYGYVVIECPACWANVLFRGKLVGRAGSPEPIQLPVGTQQLHLDNPSAGSSWTMSVVVDDRKRNVYATKLPAPAPAP